MRRFEIKDQFSYLNLHVLKYPAPKSLNYLWTFGSLLIVCFSIQVISGLFLGIFYKCGMKYYYTQKIHMTNYNQVIQRYIGASFDHLGFTVYIQERHF